MVYRHPLSSIQHPLEDPGIFSRVDILKVLKLSKMPKTEFAVHHGVMLASHLETQKIDSEIRHWSPPPPKKKTHIQKKHIGGFFVHVTPTLSQNCMAYFLGFFPQESFPASRKIFPKGVVVAALSSIGKVLTPGRLSFFQQRRV